MTITVTTAPAAPVAKNSFCNITVAGAADSTLTGYDNTKYPSSPAVRYYLTFEKSSVIEGKSYVFTVNESGGHVFMNYVFPSDGSWTVRLNDAADDSSVATETVTVS